MKKIIEKIKRLIVIIKCLFSKKCKKCKYEEAKAKCEFKKECKNKGEKK